MAKFASFLSCDSGVTTIEYASVVSFIGLVALAAIPADAISGTLSVLATSLKPHAPGGAHII
ncbi:MAG: hypothetical protein U1E46_09020 [Hyphomicrobiales bacterium]